MSTKDYLTGFHNEHRTEALPGALPEGQNAPQTLKYGLYAEQLSGTAFTVPRARNLRSWLYRIQPSVVHGPYEPYKAHGLDLTLQDPMSPHPLRFSPFPYPSAACDFIDGLTPIAETGPKGNPHATLYFYFITHSMTDRYFYNAEGEFLFILQEGALQFNTEFGILKASPSEIVVIPRGVKFQVQLQGGKARGYLCENKRVPFTLPDLGLIGANGLANARDFEFPQAHFEDKNGTYNLICKFQNHLWQSCFNYNPCNVVAWHGNYAPYRYDLKRFNTINTVSFDHPDPSIFTVLTSPSDTQGIANIDFVIFPERWMVAEHTFRSPYYHRNVMSECMGLIYGQYDAKRAGFEPGGLSIHNGMIPHGPDAATFRAASMQKLTPERYQDTLAFMLESNAHWQVTQSAFQSPQRQQDYLDCWQGLQSHFKKHS